MKKLLSVALLGLLPISAQAAPPWGQISMPTVAEAAAGFKNPPKEYSAIHWAIWGGQQSKDRIIADIDKIAAAGGGVYMINNSQRVMPKYLSPEYMDLVKAVVEQCKKNGMKLWIEGDCGYPDGFAGGIISRDYPQLGMQGIVADARCTVAGGETLQIQLPPDTLGIVARQREASTPPASAPSSKPFPLPADGTFKYTVPRGGAGELAVELPNATIRYTLTTGEPFSMTVPNGTKSITLISAAPGGARGAGGGGRRGGGAPGAELPLPNVIPMPTDGNLKWTAPAGQASWDVVFIRHAFRTSPTRNDNGEDGGATKDTLYTLIDYLNPEATKAYLKAIYEEYEKVVGTEFGKTVMGFRADETDFTNVNPWTPKLLETFQQMKGYDFKPYIPQIFGGGRLSTEAQRAKADYYDVWSAMFRDNFYKPMEDWCVARNMEFMIHLNHEEVMIGRGESMTTNEGSFWRDMRYVGVPGVDNLNQINPGTVADFPKLAGSAAHLYGRPMAWTEAGGGVGGTGKYVSDYQMVRGINYLNVRGLTGARGGGGRANAAASQPAPDPEAAAKTGAYTSRASYLLKLGRPAAQVALFHPTDSYWLGDQDADTSTVKLTTQLMEHQIDFDHIDGETLATICTLDGGSLKNLSGQSYRAVVVPSCTTIAKNALDRLRDFAKAGGKVVFVGRTPTLVADKNFLHAPEAAPDLSFATLEPAGDITAKVVAALPKPDVKLDTEAAAIKYIHRSLKDGEVYFFLNESDQPQQKTVTLSGIGQPQIWDPNTGQVRQIDNTKRSDGGVTVPLQMEGFESRFIVVTSIVPQQQP